MMIQKSPWTCGMSTQNLTNEQTTMLRDGIPSLRKWWGNAIVICVRRYCMFEHGIKYKKYIVTCNLEHNLQGEVSI